MRDWIGGAIGRTHAAAPFRTYRMLRKTYMAC